MGARPPPLVATTAQVLLARRLKQLDGLRRGRALHGETRHATLAEFAQTHLVAKAESQKFTDHWLEVTENCLDRAVEFFGADRDLAAITVADVRRWSIRLLGTPNGRKGTMSASSVRHHLSCLSNLYTRGGPVARDSRCGAPAGGSPDLSSDTQQGRMAAGPVRVRADRDVLAHRRPRVRSPGARSMTCPSIAAS